MISMRSRQIRTARRPRAVWAVCATAVGFAAAQPAFAICRVTDFTDRPLSSLNEVQRVSFVSQMERTEFDQLKSKRPGDPNHYALIASSASVADARKAAMAKLEGLKLDNIADYRDVWASEYLTDEQLRKYADCITSRAPGLFMTGRRESPTRFHLTFSHITPIGIEKISTRLIASYNIANPQDLEAHLEKLGPVDNYNARTVPLEIADPTKRAVVVMRAGWETPLFLYIPVSPTPEYFK